MPITLLTHIKVIGPSQRHLAFAKITPELLEAIRSLEFEVPDHLLTWKGKPQCPANMPTNR
jgi:hypothetical protein